MRDFTQPIASGRNGIFFTKNEAGQWVRQQVYKEAHCSLAHAIAGSPNFLGMYQFRWQLLDAGLTINDLYDENPQATVLVLNAQWEQVKASMSHSLKKNRQTRDSIEVIKAGPGESLYPELKDLLDRIIGEWDALQYEEGSSS